MTTRCSDVETRCSSNSSGGGKPLVSQSDNLWQAAVPLPMFSRPVYHWLAEVTRHSLNTQPQQRHNLPHQLFTLLWFNKPIHPSELKKPEYNGEEGAAPLGSVAIWADEGRGLVQHLELI